MGTHMQMSTHDVLFEELHDAQALCLQIKSAYVQEFPDLMDPIARVPKKKPVKANLAPLSGEG